MKYALIESGYGWLRPDGSVLSTPFQGHLQTIVQDRDAPSGMSDWLKAVDLLVEQESSDSNDFGSSASEDEHVGWHAYSSDAGDMASKQRSIMVDFLYQQGWMRLSKRVHRNVSCLFVEGFPGVLDRRRRELQAMADVMEVSRLVENPALSRTDLLETVLPHDEVQALVPSFYEAAMADFFTSKVCKGGIKPKAVVFTCSWTLTIDSFPKHLFAGRLEGLVRHGIIAYAPHWLYSHSAVSKQDIRDGRSHSQYPCDVPPTVMAQASAQPYWLAVPTREQLEQIVCSVAPWNRLDWNPTP